MTLLKANGAIPLYVQIQDLLIARIVGGEWAPTQIIPSEMQLAQELNVSQGTIRKAITSLVEKKILIRHHGKGTFVANHNNERALFQFFHIHNDNNEKVLPQSKTLSCVLQKATESEIKKLKLPKNAEVIRIERVRNLDNKPVLLESITLPKRYFSDLLMIEPDDLPNTLYELYETQFGKTVHRADEMLRAISASENDALLLEVPLDSPLLKIERIALTLDDVPIELRISHCITTGHHYQNTLF